MIFNVRVWVLFDVVILGVGYFLFFVPEIHTAYPDLEIYTIIFLCLIPGVLYLLQLLMLIRFALTDPGYQINAISEEFPGQDECMDCGGYQNRGVSHCRICGRCVFLRDKHYNLIGACISRRNFHVFSAWLTLALATFSLFLIFSFAGLIDWLESGLLPRIGTVGNLEISSLVFWFICHAASVISVFLAPGDLQIIIWPICAALGLCAFACVQLTWKFLPAASVVIHTSAFFIPPIMSATLAQFSKIPPDFTFSDFWSEISSFSPNNPENWYEKIN